MRSLLIVLLVACVALVAGTANAAGQISDNALAQMGLAGLQTMSDVQGTEIRGMGFGADLATTKGSVSVHGLGASVRAPISRWATMSRAVQSPPSVSASSLKRFAEPWRRCAAWSPLPTPRPLPVAGKCPDLFGWDGL